MCNFFPNPIKESPINPEYISIPDHRGVCISTLFTRGIMYHVNAIVGDVVPKKNMMNLNNFDGQLFQWLYLKAKLTQSVDGLYQYLSQDQCIAMETIYALVTYNGNKVKQ